MTLEEKEELLTRFWKEGLKCPWCKYQFGQIELGEAVKEDEIYYHPSCLEAKHNDK